jgi:hypothetical protein
VAETPRGRAGAAAALALAGGTGLLGALALIGGTSAGLGAWIHAWSVPAAPGPTLRLGATPPLALGLGVLGLVGMLRARRIAPVLVVAVSLAWAVCTAARPGGDPAAALLTVVILTAASAPAVAEIQARSSDIEGARWRTAVGVAVVLLAVAMPGILRTARGASGRSVTGAPASFASVRLLERDLERLSAQRAVDSTELPVDVLCQPSPDPLLRWTLREARHVRFLAGSLDPRDTGPALALGPDPASSAELPCDAPLGRAGARYQAGATTVVLWVPHAR